MVTLLFKYRNFESENYFATVDVLWSGWLADLKNRHSNYTFECFQYEFESAGAYKNDIFVFCTPPL